MPMFDTIHAYIFLKTRRLFIKIRQFFSQIWRESGRIPVYFASDSRFSYFFTPNTPVFLLFFHPKPDVFDLTKCQEIYPVSNGIYFFLLSLQEPENHFFKLSLFYFLSVKPQLHENRIKPNKL